MARELISIIDELVWIAGLCNKKIIAPVLFEGNCDTSVSILCGTCPD